MKNVDLEKNAIMTTPQQIVPHIAKEVAKIEMELKVQKIARLEKTQIKIARTGSNMEDADMVIDADTDTQMYTNRL